MIKNFKTNIVIIFLCFFTFSLKSIKFYDAETYSDIAYIDLIM